MLAASPAHATIVPGDVNEDATVDVADVVTLLQHLFTGQPLSDEARLNADVNQSDTVDVSDAVYLGTYLFGSPQGPPPQHPPYCEILDSSGESFEPPRYEAGTYWTDASGVPFAGGFVSDASWPDPANPGVGITNPNVQIPRGASVCGTTTIASTGTDTPDVVLEDNAVITDSTITVISTSSSPEQLRLRGDSVLSGVDAHLDDVVVLINDSWLTQVDIESQSGGSDSPLIIIRSEALGSLFDLQPGQVSPITIRDSVLEDSAITGSPNSQEPIVIEDSDLEDSSVWSIDGGITILQSELVGVSVLSDAGDTTLDGVQGVGGDITGGALTWWCMETGQYYIGDQCNALDYNVGSCPFPLPSPSWPNCF